jgi:hypothetical protein
VEEDVRQRLGTDFAAERNAQLDADCGRTENVRRIVEKAAAQGKLDEDD